MRIGLNAFFAVHAPQGFLTLLESHQRKNLKNLNDFLRGMNDLHRSARRIPQW